MARDRLGSRLGFILLSAGCAIGVGNVWKFPYMAGQYGGGAFVLIYLFFLVVLGLPVLTIEFSLGRASQKSPVCLYPQLAPPKGGKWQIHGYACMIGCVLLMMFYTTVCGWMIQYFVNTARGTYAGLNPEEVSAAFGSMVSDPVTMMIYTTLVVIVGFFVCSFSLQGGLERVTKFMMIALLVLMVVLAVNSFTMPGSSEGLSFYLKPDLAKMQEIGIGKVVVGAMNQAFFTLSLGIGSMAIFGSYLDKNRALMGESVNVILLDTFVAITAGLIIFPACFTYDVEVGSGPSLIFETLPNVFNNMPMGTFWGALFFIFMSFAALSTVFAVFENIIACSMDLWGWNRKKACLICGIALIILSLPCALGFNVLSGIHPLGGTTNLMDLEDFIVSNVLLPLGSMIFVLFATHKKGWGWKNFVAEANTGTGLKVQNWMRGYISYVLPVIIAALFVIGIYNYFFAG